MRLETRGADVVLRDIERMAHMDTTPLMELLGREVVTGIVRRTAAGMDENDVRFRPIKNTRSTPLWDTGTMLNSVDVLSASKSEAIVGFNDDLSAQKAIWQHYGTSGPYEIKPKNKKALAFASSGAAGSFSNSVRVGSRYSKKGQQFYRVGQSPKTSRVTTGMTVVKGVMHPGLTARPFFGISPALRARLEQIADQWFDDYAKGTA